MLWDYYRTKRYEVELWNDSWISHATPDSFKSSIGIHLWAIWLVMYILSGLYEAEWPLAFSQVTSRVTLAMKNKDTNFRLSLSSLCRVISSNRLTLRLDLRPWPFLLHHNATSWPWSVTSNLLHQLLVTLVVSLLIIWQTHIWMQ